MIITGMAVFISTMFWLSAGHALADFPLQTDFLAGTKRRSDPRGAHGFWFFALSAHALIHAACVAIATGSVLLGLAEFIAHWLIDFAKCEAKIGRVVDQVLHFACKIAWALILVWCYAEANRL